MSWEDIMRRVLPPAGGISPHTTSAYGATNRPPGSTNPHRGDDFNYNVGPNGQRGINLQHPALRAPVDGVVENAGEGNFGRIAIRDKNGFLHEILHTHTRHVAIGDPVAGINKDRLTQIRLRRLTLENTSNICRAPAPIRAMDLATHRAR